MSTGAVNYDAFSFEMYEDENDFTYFVPSKTSIRLFGAPERPFIRKWLLILFALPTPIDLT